MLTYPHINPIAISIGPVFGIGPLRVHWYGIMYLIGFVAAWLLARYRARRPGSTWTALDIDDLIFYCAMGVILGGRIGWCIFYGHDVIAENWLNVLHIWDGGMSFHGGMLGVTAAVWLFARIKKKRFADVLDFVAPLPGVGLMAGRFGNFINGELWGKQTTLPWGFRVVDPDGQVVVRHPSQLYEQAPAPIGAHGLVPDRLRTGPVRRRMGPPAGCEHRLSGGELADHGHAAHPADDSRRRDHDGGRLSPRPAERQSGRRQGIGPPACGNI